MKQKRLVLVAIGLFIAFTGFAQTQKGARMVGGSGYLNLKDHFEIRLSPSYGQFIADDLAVGGQVSWGHYSHNENSSSHTSLGPFIRYYLGSPVNKVFFLGSMDFRNSSHRNNPRNERHSENAFDLGLGIGFVHFITQQVGLEAILNYKNTWAENNNSYDRLYISLGFQIHLPSKR